MSDVAAVTGLSGPAVGERVRKLEDRGVISGYSARIVPEALGLGLTALVAVTLAGPQYRDSFLAGIAQLHGVVECHHVAGDDDYILKAHVAGTSGLEALVSEGIKSLPGIARTSTTVVLSTALERPLAPPAEA